MATTVVILASSMSQFSDTALHPATESRPLQDNAQEWRARNGALTDAAG